MKEDFAEEVFKQKLSHGSFELVLSALQSDLSNQMTTVKYWVGKPKYWGTEGGKK